MKGPDGYSEEDWLALSGIQHFSFCKRQWALIHIEQLWSENTGEKYGLCFAQAFQTVSDNFHVIPDVTHNVVVPYGQATELLDMLHRGELSEKISVLRRLQEYTVSLFDDDYHDLARKHAISLANEDFGVFLLNEEYYNDKYGVVREAEMPLLLM